jgi:hypothetical protein
MRIFQNSGVMPAYRLRLQQLSAETVGFRARLDIFLNDRFGAMHFLLPVHQRHPDAFFTNGDDKDLQRAWAQEKGLKAETSLEDILLAQIEEHRTEVFYNNDPVRYPSAFVRRLPGSVRRKIAWRAAPSGTADFTAYDMMVCNFRSILEGYRKSGMRAEWFAPAHDPELDAYADNTDRPVDIAFIGTYSRHHSRRAAVIEAVAALGDRYNVALHLDGGSRFQRLADSPLGLVGPLRKYRRPEDVRAASQGPVFGRDLYKTLSSAKIIVNGAIDMAGQDRGNMRCWEAMGAGALLLTDAGVYPEGMVDGKTMMTYFASDTALHAMQSLLLDADRLAEVSQNGKEMIRKRYSKKRQFEDFLILASS